MKPANCIYVTFGVKGFSVLRYVHLSVTSFFKNVLVSLNEERVNFIFNAQTD